MHCTRPSLAINAPLCPSPPTKNKKNSTAIIVKEGLLTTFDFCTQAAAGSASTKSVMQNDVIVKAVSRINIIWSLLCQGRLGSIHGWCWGLASWGLVQNNKFKILNVCFCLGNELELFVIRGSSPLLSKETCRACLGCTGMDVVVGANTGGPAEDELAPALFGSAASGTLYGSVEPAESFSDSLPVWFVLQAPTHRFMESQGHSPWALLSGSQVLHVCNCLPAKGPKT